MEKSVVLIDAENILSGWNDYCSRGMLDEKLDYKKLVDILSTNTNLLRAYFYDGIHENINSRKQHFLESLERKGIQLRTKILRNRKIICKHCNLATERLVQKGVDVSLATDVLRHAFQKTCDVCIIVSGDEDYSDAVRAAKDLGIKVWIVSFKHSLSSELERSADKIIYLEDIFEQIKFVK